MNGHYSAFQESLILFIMLVLRHVEVALRVGIGDVEGMHMERDARSSIQIWIRYK